jgi:tetratricopeptide (TPR) repeat protein
LKRDPGRKAISLIPAVVGMLSGLPAIRGRWVWDDFLLVHFQLGAFHSLSDLFFPPAGIPNFSAHYYRPLTLLSFLADRLAFGEWAPGFHLTVLLAHGATCAGVYLLARSFLPSGRDGSLAAMAGALLFAAHPIHAESICWIAGRADVLAGLCVVAASIGLRHRPLGRGSIAAAAVLFAAGCLFKEVAFGLLPMAPLLAASEVGVSGEAGGGENRPWAALGALGAAAGAVLALRGFALGGLGADAPRAPGGAGSLSALGGALWFYLPRAFLPLPAAPYVESIPHGAAAWAGGALGIAILAVAVALLVGARRGRRAEPVGFGLLWLIVCLAPSLVPAVYRVSGVPLAERYLYLPTVGLALAAAGGIARLSSARAGARVSRWAPAAAFAAAAVLGAIALSRSVIWTNEISLWTAASSADPSPSPRIYLATAFEETGDHAKAETIYRALLADASSLDPRQRSLVSMNLGILLQATRRREEALRLFEESVALDPGSSLGWYNLSRALWESALIDPERGTLSRPLLERAQEAIRRAETLAPLDPRILLEKGKIVGSLGRRDEAREALGIASRMDPTGEVGAEARRLLALIR